MSPTSTDPPPPSPSSSAPPGPPLALTVALAAGPCRAGYPVELVLTLQNLSEAPVRVEHWSAWFEYELEARGPDGRELPRTRFGNARHRDAGAVTSATDLAPGAALETRVLVSRLYDMTAAGAYRVAVARELRAGPEGEWVRVCAEPVAFDLAD